MASRQVVCGENEGLALYIYWKREQLIQKPNFSENLDATFTTAYRNVCDCENPISNLRDASKVRGIGAWMLKQIKDFFDEEHPSPEDEAPQAKKKRTRRYLPQKNSAPYAILITLYRGFREGKKYMMKQELIDASELSGLSRMHIHPGKGSSASGRFGDSTKDWYSGWSSMKTLVSKGLVVKSSCPAKYMLTDEGIATAEECMTKGGLTITNQNLSPNLINATRNQNATSNSTPTDSPKDNTTPNLISTEATTRNLLQRNQTAHATISRSNAPAYANSSQEYIRNRDTWDIPPAASKRPDRETWIRRHQDASDEPASSSTAIINNIAVPPLNTGEKFCDVYDVILVLDDRECFSRTGKGITSKSRFAERLREQYRVQIEIRHLPVGDAIWIAYHKFTRKDYVLDFIVERKAVDDFWSSIKDTRYKQQKLRLMRSGINRLIYLIEGDPNFTESAEALKTAALTTEIVEGFDVQRTRDTHDTINRYGELTNAIVKRYGPETGSVGHGPGSSSVHCSTCMSYEEFVEHCNEVEKERVRDVFGVQLMQIRHVTEDIALSILEKYPTVFSLAQAYSSLERDVSKQENLLTGIPIKNKNKAISSVISKNVYKFFWSP